MRKYIILILVCSFRLLSLTAQEIIQIYKAERVMYEASILEIEEIKFKNNSSIFNFGNKNTIGIPISEIDSITFSNDAGNSGSNIIYIMYNDDDVTIINPLAEQGISIAAEQCQVSITANSGIYGVEYHISGNSANGSLSVTSDLNFVLALSNLNLTNPSGAAVMITNEVTSYINLSGNSRLTDGAESSKNGTIRSKGDIVFCGQGSLNISGLAKHGISAEKAITIENGSITIQQSVSDGLHSEGFTMNGGSLDITAGSDAIDAGAASIQISAGTIKITSAVDDSKGIKSDANITINGGTIEMTVSGAQSKGLSSKQNIVINSGTINIKASGKTVLESSGSGYEPAYCSALKCAGNLTVNGGDITIETTSANDGGKGFSADGEIVINNGTIKITTAGSGTTYTNESGAKDSYTSCCIKSDTNISILGGTIMCSSSGSGGKGIAADGTITVGKLNADNSNLVLNVTTSGNRFQVSSSSSSGGNRPGGPGGGGGFGQDSGDYANPKAIKSLGNLTINSGTISVNCTQSTEGGEGIESKAKLYINGGIVEIGTYDDCINASTHIEISGGQIYCVARGNDAIDSNGTITISGGLTIANGASTPEGGIDCDNNTFKLTGGVLIATGGNNSSPTTSSTTQRYATFTSSANTSVCVKNSSGDIVLLYKMPSTGTSVLFSAPELTTGSSLLTGGTISGGTTFNGYTTGGTYSGGSSKSITVK